jgi:hypothetical protein
MLSLLSSAQSPIPLFVFALDLMSDLIAIFEENPHSCFSSNVSTTLFSFLAYGGLKALKMASLLFAKSLLKILWL